jgi:hypothetical protein
VSHATETHVTLEHDRLELAGKRREFLHRDPSDLLALTFYAISIIDISNEEKITEKER